MLERIGLLLSAALIGLLVAAAPVRAEGPTIVSIAGSVSSNDPFPAIVKLQATVIGEDADTLAGAGHHTVLFAWGGFAEHSKWTLTEGAVHGTSVVLSGFVTKSTAPLDGTPIQLEADGITGALTLTVGPFTGGFPGLVVTSQGFGNVVIQEGS
jgi:hypothetical protein